MADLYQTETSIDTMPPPGKPGMSPWSVVAIMMVAMLAGFGLVGPLVGFLVAFPFYPGTGLEFLQELSEGTQNPAIKTPALIVQGFSTFVGLAVVPALFWTAIKKRRVFTLLGPISIQPLHVLLAAGLVLTSIGPGSWIIEWNANLDLPDGAFENWAKDFEKRAMDLTLFLTKFDSFGQYLFGMFVIAVLPAFAEEFMFRGILQSELYRGTRNIHAAIWISAILFSAFHLQFYGFVPRILLGAMFGYIYHWSGNLWAPMLAHFLNNGLQLTLMYTQMDQELGMDSVEPESLPISVVLIGTGVFAALIYAFYKSRTKPELT